MTLIDLTDLDWRRLSEAGSSHGSLYKATRIVNDTVYYYKMSLMIGKKVVGHEAVNEVIVSRLLDILNIPHVHYDLQLAKVRIKDEVITTYICVSKDFKTKGQSSIPLEVYYNLVCPDTAHVYKESPYDMLVNMGFRHYLDQMFVVDFLTINRDRHGYNIELVFFENQISLAPLFDNGLSFVSSLNNNVDLVRVFDPMRDDAANNFIGSDSLFSNLRLVSDMVDVNQLTERDRKRIFYDLSLAVSKEHLNKIWEIIWTRYSYLRDNGYLREFAVTTNLFQ